MSSIRKIWSAPIAALALVLMLVGVVFAQTPPTVGAEIPDQTITITASAETAVIDLLDVDGSDADAFTDTGDTHCVHRSDQRPQCRRRRY